MKIYSVAAGELMEVERVCLSDREWRQRLTPEQYRVIRTGGTECAFSGESGPSLGNGVYQCVGCGTDLFCSGAKFESGTGWPGFFQPVHEANLQKREDRRHGMRRMEVRCVRCDAHLGHVFPDGPKPTGLRYCINSAALIFRADGEGTVRGGERLGGITRPTACGYGATGPAGCTA